MWLVFTSCRACFAQIQRKFSAAVPSACIYNNTQIKRGASPATGNCGHRWALSTKNRTSKGFLEHSWKNQSSTHLQGVLVCSPILSPPELVSAQLPRNQFIFHLRFPALVWLSHHLRLPVKCLPEMDLSTVFKEGMPQASTLHNLPQGCVKANITACFKSMQCKVTTCHLHWSDLKSSSAGFDRIALQAC